MAYTSLVWLAVCSMKASVRVRCMRCVRGRTCVHGLPDLDICPACTTLDDTGEVPGLQVFTTRIASELLCAIPSSTAAARAS